MIDKVEVKTLGELSPREIEHDNPEIRHTEEMATFLGQLYNREVDVDDVVTVIRFSQIMNGPVHGLPRRERPSSSRSALARHAARACLRAALSARSARVPGSPARALLPADGAGRARSRRGAAHDHATVCYLLAGAALDR